MDSKKKKELLEKHIKDYCEKAGHRLPTTRREFLSSGILGLTATALMPTFGSIITNKAYGSQILCDNKSNELPAFIQITLAGGAALCSNFVVGDEKGNRLPTYKRMGLGTSPETTNIFANQAPFAAQSGFLQGLTSKAAVSTLNSTSFCAVSSFVTDDTTDNEQNITGLVYEAGLRGQYLPPLLGSAQYRKAGQVIVNKSKFFSSPAYIKAPSTMAVSSIDSLVNSLSFEPNNYGSMGKKMIEENSRGGRVSQLIAKINQIQLQQIEARTPATEKFRQLMGCSSQKNLEHLVLKKKVPNIDARKDSSLNSLWSGGENNDENMILASICLSTIKGVSGPAFIQLGGYDYHQGADTREASDLMDKKAGELVGKIIQTAQKESKPVFIYITSDGSTFSPDSDEGGIGFVGDRATHGMGFMIAYKPGQAPAMGGYDGGPSFQLNHFDKNGLEVNTLHTIGKNSALCSGAVFANYLSFSGRLDLFEKIHSLKEIKNHFNAVTKLDNLLRFRG